MLFHQLDPRTKILWVFFLNSAIMTQHTILGLSLTASLLLVPAVILAKRTKETIVDIVHMTGYLFFLAVIQTVVKVLSGGGLSSETILFAVTEVCRFLIMIISAMLLFATTDSADIGRAIRTLKKGGGRWDSWIESFAFIMSSSYQLVPLFLGEIEEIVQVMRGRGIGVREGSKISQVKGLLGMTIPLFNRTLEVLKNSIIAILNYGYDPFVPRSQHVLLRAQPRDYVATVYALAITVLAGFQVIGA